MAAADDDEWLHLLAVRKLRRLNAAAAEKRRRIKAALLALDGGQGPQEQKRREESPFSWDDHLALLRTEQKFKLRYRLTYDGFNKLLDDDEFGIRGDLEAVNKKMAKRAKWGYLVCAETKLAICLRYLATRYGYGAPPSNLYFTPPLWRGKRTMIHVSC